MATPGAGRFGSPHDAASGATPPSDHGTQLAEERTELARERSFLAAERSLMAWIRTALSMIGFGFTLVKFLEYFTKERGLVIAGPFGRQWSPAAFGIALITLGTLALAVAVMQHHAALTRLRQRGLAPRWSLALTVGAVVAFLGVFALASLVLNY